MRIEREYIREVVLRKHRREGREYLEAELRLAISLPREYAGKKVRVYVVIEPLEEASTRAVKLADLPDDILPPLLLVEWIKHRTEDNTVRGESLVRYLRHDFGIETNIEELYSRLVKILQEDARTGLFRKIALELEAEEVKDLVLVPSRPPDFLLYFRTTPDEDSLCRCLQYVRLRLDVIRKGLAGPS